MRFTKAELRSSVIGMVMGDGCLYQPKNRHAKQTRLSFEHCLEQMPYGIWKASLLSQLTGREVHPHIYTRKGGFSDGKETVQFASSGHSLYRIIRKLAYPNNKKTFNRKLLNYLTPLGLAIWFQDDGCLRINKRNGWVLNRQMYLYTACPETEADLVIDYFKEMWGINWRKFNIRKFSDGYNWSLFAGAKEAHKFFEIISSYVHPCMRYKIDLKYTVDKFKPQQRVAEPFYLGLEDIVQSASKTSNGKMQTLIACDIAEN